MNALISHHSSPTTHLVVLVPVGLLFVDGFQHFRAARNRGLREVLAAAQFFQGLRFLEFALVLFEHFVNDFAVFYLNDEHEKGTFLMKK